MKLLCNDDYVKKGVIMIKSTDYESLIICRAAVIAGIGYLFMTMKC